MDTIPVEMGYAKRGWFRLQIPALLPKKESGSPIYIQQYLYPALRRYFAGKPPALYQNCVLAPCVLSGTSGACLSGPR